MHLTLFFSRGNSLATWEKIGILEREIALYKNLSKQNIRVSFLTYGTNEERFFGCLPGIDILYNRWNLPSIIYELFCPWLHSKAFQKSDLIKTNQVKGAHLALLTGKLWHKPVIVRQGYSWSKHLSRERGHRLKSRFAEVYEYFVYKFADQIVVTTYPMQAEILQRHPSKKSQISIIPNYVDTELFKPAPELKSSSQIIYVGRLAEQKNLSILIQACSSLAVPLKIIGRGPLEEILKNEAHRLDAKVTFLGSIPHRNLPEELNQASIFILPSLYEGHPKALIEAMACGLAVIGTNVSGIRELIHHGENGWLCQPTIESLREAISHLLANPNLCRSMGQKGREFILENFSLEKIARLEIELYWKILEKSNASAS